MRFAGSGIARNVLNARGAESRFRREDIADCLLVPFDFFLLYVGEWRGESVICVGSMGDFFSFTVAHSDPGFNSKLRSRV